MEKIKVNFGDFWPSFQKDDNYFTRILRKKYEVEISENPDFYFFTHPYNGKRTYLNYKCHRIFLGWENERADWRIADYVLDSDFYSENPRHQRYPIWAGWDLTALMQPKNPRLFLQKKKFCCMLVSNGKAKERIAFFNELSKYKKVDSGGRYLNNIGHAVDNKMEFIKDYKFVISFENSSYPGYTTEKLIEPMYVNSIPIYWGNEMISKDFNTASFVNVNDFANYKDAIDYIIQLDQNDELMLQMAGESWLNNNQVSTDCNEQSLAEFFDFVLLDSKNKRPVGASWYNDRYHRLSLFAQRLQSSLYLRLGIRRGFR